LCPVLARNATGSTPKLQLCHGKFTKDGHSCDPSLASTQPLDVGTLDSEGIGYIWLPQHSPGKAWSKEVAGRYQTGL
jgi:hypothetical protein